MVFDYQNGFFHPRTLECSHPLACIQLRGIKEFGVFSAATYFTIGKGIHPEVNEGGQL